MKYSSYKLKPQARWGALVALLLALPASAQYVSTLVSGLDEPWGVAVGADGNLYVTDSGNNQLIKYSISTGATNSLAVNQFDVPRGIVAARGGLVVVDQFNQVIRFVTFNGTVSTLAGSLGNYGQNDGVGTNATFSYPVGITVDAAGNLYVADWGNGAIREITTNNVVSTLALSGYQLNGPKALTFDGSGNLWVADTASRSGGSNVVCLISNNIVTPIAGEGLAGAQFSSPSGLVWDAPNNRLIISDSGDSVICALSYSNGYSVQTIAGISGNNSMVNGALGVATFNYPVGVAVDIFDSGFYIADYGNNAVRVVQPSAPLPPVSPPTFGYVTFPQTGNPPGSSVFVQSSGATFQNPIPLAVEAEIGTQTFFTYGPTGSNIPQPTTNSAEPNIYPGDGTQPPLESFITTNPGTNDITIYAFSQAAGRQPSPVTNARFIFLTANPQIIGTDAASIKLDDITSSALIYYTIDGSSPTNDGSDGPGAISGTSVAFDITSNVTLSVRAFAPGFAASGVLTETLSVSNYVGNQMTFGFEGGVASSRFIAAAGQTFYAPVTLTEIGSPVIYSMQFNLSVTNGTGPALNGFNPSYQSFLLNLPQSNPPVYYPIPPGIVVPTGNGGLTNNTGILVDSAHNTLEIGYITSQGQTNLYDTLRQHLTELSMGADILFSDNDNQVVVGGFSFAVPATAPTGSTYLIQITRPSAATTTDIVPTPVYIQAPTNGSLTNGAINSIKYVTVGSVPYLVGDVYPLYWYNAGDFGDFNLLNVDVMRTFISAVDSYNVPPPGSDFFDAMDSSDANNNQLFNGNDTSINSMAKGDGVLDVSDVYVTFRRSLNSNLVNYVRFWTNGQRMAVPTNNVVSNLRQAATPKVVTSGPQYLTVRADQVNAGGNLNIQVPVRVLAAASMPIKVMMVSFQIEALDGSPPLTVAPTFTAASGLASTGTLTGSYEINNYAAAWLDTSVTGISGTNIIGNLSVTLPTNVNPNSAYLVHFYHFSASPNGIANFQSTAQDGLITLSDRTGSSWHDGIPDTWRLTYFNSVSNALSAANADPDGDGASNWQEFIAGTNPLDNGSVFQFSPAVAPVGSYFTLQWPSVVNKNYAVQSAASINGVWTTLTNLTGTGQTMQWTDIQAAGGGKFYRASVH